MHDLLTHNCSCHGTLGCPVVYMEGGPSPPQLSCQSPDSLAPRTHCIRSGSQRIRRLAGYLGWARSHPPYILLKHAPNLPSLEYIYRCSKLQKFKKFRTLHKPANRTLGDLFREELPIEGKSSLGIPRIWWNLHGMS